MKKLLKLATVMLFAVAVVCTTGCKKSSDNDNNNNGGGGGTTAGNVTVTTYNPTSVSSNEATCGVEANPDDSNYLEEIGVCWGTSAYPTVNNNKLSTGNCDEPFVCNIPNLQSETTYHVRGYALYNGRYYYGDDKSFTTLAGGGGTSTSINKISKIYYGYTYLSEVSYDNGITWEQDCYNEEPSELNQEWYWNNDEITKINIFSSEKAQQGTYMFQYNNNGLVTKITNTDNDNYMQFSYSGNVMNKVDSYYHGVLDQTIELVYSNNRLVRINYTYINEDKAIDNSKISLVDVLFKSKMAQSYIGNGVMPYIEITWTGDNITQAKEVYPNEGEFLITFTYDNKNNPYYGNNALAAWAFCSSGIMNLSKNNVLTENCEYFTLTNSYHYTNNYPVQTEETEIHYYTYSNIMERDTFVAHYSYVYLTE